MMSVCSVCLPVIAMVFGCGLNTSGLPVQASPFILAAIDGDIASTQQSCFLVHDELKNTIEAMQANSSFSSAVILEDIV
ncbi:MAG TPA: hypothetical protein VF679_07500 [Pedobacter sp.]